MPEVDITHILCISRSFEPMSVRCHVGSCTSVTVPEFRVCSRRGSDNGVSSKFFDHVSNRRSSHLCLCPLSPPLFALLLCLLSCSRLCCKVKFTSQYNMARLGAEGASCCRWRRRWWWHRGKGCIPAARQQPWGVWTSSCIDHSKIEVARCYTQSDAINHLHSAFHREIALWRCWL